MYFSGSNALHAPAVALFHIKYSFVAVCTHTIIVYSSIATTVRGCASPAQQRPFSHNPTMQSHPSNVLHSFSAGMVDFAAKGNENRGVCVQRCD